MHITMVICQVVCTKMIGVTLTDGFLLRWFGSCVYLFVCLFVCLHVCLVAVLMKVLCMSVYMSVCMSVCSASHANHLQCFGTVGWVSG